MISRSSIFHAQGIVNACMRREIAGLKKYCRGILVDVGCGDSPYGELIRDRVTYYIGTDFPGDKEVRSNKLVRVYSKGEALPFRDGSVDTVLCTEVLEHLPEPCIAVMETYRALKCGGYLLVSVPQTWYLHNRPHDYCRFTRYGLEYLLKKCGFEIIMVRRKGNFWRMIGQMLNYHLEYSFSGPVTQRYTGMALVHMLIKCSRRVIYAVIYVLFSALDNLDKHGVDTLGYIAIARKRG